MLTIILSVLFILSVVVAIVTAVFKSRKTYWVEALVRAIFTILSAILSLFIASILSSLLAPPLANYLTGMSVGTDLEALIEEVPSVIHLAATAITVVITPIVFSLLFSLLSFLLCFFLAKPTCKRILIIAQKIKKTEENYVKTKYEPYFEKKYRKFTYPSLICCIVISVASLIMSIIPYVTSLYIVGTAAKSIDTDVAIVDEFTSAATENVGTVTVMALGGDKMYDALTHFTVDGNDISIMDEAEFVADAMDSLFTLADPAASPDEIATSLRTSKESIEGTSVIPMLVSDIVNAAGEDWLAGRDFHGIACPSAGEGLDGIVHSFIECTQGSTCDTMREDIATLFELLAITAENEVLSASGETVDVSGLIENEKFITDVSYVLLENERLAPLVGTILDMSVEMLAKSFGIPENKTAALAAFPENQDLVNNGSVITLEDMYIEHTVSPDPEAEAKAIASIIKSLGNLLPTENEDGTNKVDIVDFITNLGPLFDNISQSKLMGTKTAKMLLTAILQSEQVRIATEVNIADMTNIAVSITNAVDGGSSYTKQLGSLANILDMLTRVEQIKQTITDPETGETVEITDDTVITEELVDEIITNITPETVDAIKPLVPTTEVTEAEKDNLLNIANQKWQEQQSNTESELTDDEFLDVVSSIASMIDVQIAVDENGNIVIVNP